MNKIFNSKNINYLVLLISLIFYIFMMFNSDITLDTGKKELENILILAIPCFMLLTYSLNTKDKSERKQILIFYLIYYFLAMIGFTFSNFRDNILIDSGIMNRDYNLIPFKSIIELLTSPLGLKVGLYNIIGNFFMLTPLAILLPLINDRFKQTKNYLITIILLSLTIESLQYITKIGSLDIDDLILNISGSFILHQRFIKTKLNKYLYNLFYELTIPNKMSKIIYYIFLILLVLLYTWYISLIIQREQEKKIDFSNLICLSNEKTYLGSYGKYNYYSECKLDGYIIRGNEEILIDDLLKRFASTIDNYQQELKLIKEESITNIEVTLSDNTKKLISESDKNKIYLVNIEKISYTQNNHECIIEDIINEEDTKCSSIYTLVEVTNHNIKAGYVIQKGEYYNILSCTKGSYPIDLVIDYVLPINYEITENTCLDLK